MFYTDTVLLLLPSEYSQYGPDGPDLFLSVLDETRVDCHGRRLEVVEERRLMTSCFLCAQADSQSSLLANAIEDALHSHTRKLK